MAANFKADSASIGNSYRNFWSTTYFTVLENIVENYIGLSLIKIFAVFNDTNPGGVINEIMTAPQKY